jgi:anti-sigma-K factor RskA
MAEPQSRGNQDLSTSEDRFARQDSEGSSHWSSATAAVAVVVVVAIVLIYLAVLR